MGIIRKIVLGLREIFSSHSKPSKHFEQLRLKNELMQVEPGDFIRVTLRDSSIQNVAVKVLVNEPLNNRLLVEIHWIGRENPERRILHYDGYSLQNYLLLNFDSLSDSDHNTSEPTELDILQAELRQAKKDEAWEKAAQLRDQINELKNKNNAAS